MKKIMYVHHGDTFGGAPRSLAFLLSRLNKAEYEAVVVCRGNEENRNFFAELAKEVYVENGIHPFHANTVVGSSFKQTIYNFVYFLPTFFQARKIIKRINPDIIHLNSTCMFAVAIAAKTVNKRIKVVCHIREPLIQGSLQAEILKRTCMRCCDRFVAIDEYDGRSVDSKLEKTDIIYNFVDFSQYNSAVKSNVLREELNLENDCIIYLVLARISPENGIYELVKEWSEICCDNKIHLVIVGEKKNQMIEYTALCKAVAEKATNIHILPFRSDVPAVISSSDVMLCPFTQPHFARAIIEAAAMGKISVSKYIDGPKELIIDGETGFFYGDGSELSQIIKYISNNAEAVRTMSKKAESYALRKFNADINALKTFDIYSK